MNKKRKRITRVSQNDSESNEDESQEVIDELPGRNENKSMGSDSE